MVAAAVVAAATTSPGRANWSPWKPSRSQSGCIRTYIYPCRGASAASLSAPSTPINSHPLSLSLPPSDFLRLLLCLFVLIRPPSFPLFFSISLDFRCSLAAPSLFSLLRFIYPLSAFLVSSVRTISSSLSDSHLSHRARPILSLDPETRWLSVSI